MKHLITCLNTFDQSEKKKPKQQFLNGFIFLSIFISLLLMIKIKVKVYVNRINYTIIFYMKTILINSCDIPIFR